LGNPLNFQKWWFGDVTPRLKFASAMMRRDLLKETQPELFRQNNKGAKLREYQKIHRDIEGRFGEMHYDNLFWPKALKQAGTTFMLSLGWRLGMFRTLGDGVIDLTRNAAHMATQSEYWKSLPPAQRTLLTNRVAFEGMYAAQMIMSGLAISYFVGGKKQNLTLWDGVYPVVGHSDGTEKRVNMQYFFKDIPAFWEYQRQQGSALGAGIHMGLNWMNPMMMSVIQASTNKDYMGHTISSREGFDNFLDRALYLAAGGYQPMSFENMGVPGQTQTDMAMDFLGFSPSGRWTMRTDTENRVIARSVELRGQSDLHNAREKYRQAYLSHDHGMMEEAHKELLKLGQTDKNIKLIQKNAHITTAQYAFRQMSSHEQAAQWHRFSPKEQMEFWPYVHKRMKQNHQIWLGQQ
jgi:hypothetical protein